MIIFILSADKSKLTPRQREPVASGSVNVHQVQFEFSPDWDGLTRTAVFKAGACTRYVQLNESGRCFLPWEVLETPDLPLMAGVYGARGASVALPTVWASLGMILPGVDAPEAGAAPSTPELWAQALAGKGDTLGYTETGELGLYAGDRLLSTVPADACGIYEIGHGLRAKGGVLSVDSVDDFQGDNTLPMTAAGVQNVVGSIEALLGII